MANHRAIKRQHSLWPFLTGLILGLILSMGLRILSSKSFLFCRKLSHNSFQIEMEPGLRSEFKIEPDQIVNLNNVKKSDSMKDSHEKLNNSLQKVKNVTEDYSFGGIKDNLLLVGVMTAERYLHSRALGVYDTWAKSIPGKVIFFTGGNNTDAYINSNSGHNDGIIMHSVNHETALPLVALPGVDDSYPPQKKSFMMLKYMYEHYGDKFEWFMRADDDVYIRTEKLSDFLRSINSRHLYFIGQAGRGNRAEKGTLNLGQNENFCMGGPGIILSKPTLAKVAPNVRQCLQDMYSTHEDVEVGRCVQRFAGISCTWAYEMQSIFHHNSSGEKAFTETLKRREVHKAITLHPIKNFKYLYRLDAYFQELKIQELLYESILLQRELLNLHSKETSNTHFPHPHINQLHGRPGAFNNNSALKDIRKGWSWRESVSEFMADKQLNITGLQPGLNKYLPRDESQIIGWNFISKGIYSSESVNPKQKIDAASKEALEDVVREMMDIINGYSRVRGRVIDFKEILYGYHRVNPLYGDDFVLDLFMTYKKYRGRKMTVPVRRHVYIQRPYSELNLQLETSSKYISSLSEKEARNNMSAVPSLSHLQQSNLVLIVPLSGRFSTFERFLENFHGACIDSMGVSSSLNANGESEPGDVDPHLDESRQKKSSRKIFKSAPADSEKEKDSPYRAAASTTVNSSMSLIVVYFGTDGEKEKFHQLVNSFREKTSLASCKIKVVQVDGEFSRSIALETGISQCSEDDLLFLIDVDIAFTPDSLQRVRLNVVQGKRVYFPIVFSQYNPLLYKYDQTNKNNKKNFENDRKADNRNLSTDIGYWREYGFGTAAFFKSDFRLAGGFDVSIKGWGKEDVALFDRFLQTELIVFRAPDPDLIHVYHTIHCDEKLSLSQREMCLGTQANTLGSYQTLMQFIFRHRKDSATFQALLKPYPLI